MYHACILFLMFVRCYVWWFWCCEDRYRSKTSWRADGVWLKIKRRIKGIDYINSGNEMKGKQRKKEIGQKAPHKRKVSWKQKEPGCSPGRSAWLVWHLTSSSLYTELLTVMQRAQYYSNKAREINRLKEEKGKHVTGPKRRRENTPLKTTLTL